MEILIEILIEVLGEIGTVFVEFLAGRAGDRSERSGVRIAALLVVMLLILLFLGLIAFLGCIAWNFNILLGLVVFALDAVFLFFFVRKLIKLYHN